MRQHIKECIMLRRFNNNEELKKKCQDDPKQLEIFFPPIFRSELRKYPSKLSKLENGKYNAALYQRESRKRKKAQAKSDKELMERLMAENIRLNEANKKLKEDGDIKREINEAYNADDDEQKGTSI